MTHTSPFVTRFVGAVAALALALSLMPSAALAVTPSINASTFSGDSIQVNVYGDANQAINLYYYPQNGGSAVSRGSIGTTNSSGSYNATVNASAYSVPSGSQAYVVINGQQSPSVTWPYYTGGGNNSQSVSFSQNSLALNSGQSITVSIYGGNGGYYVSTNSNTGLVTTTLSGSQLTLSANGGAQNGTANIQVCSSGYNSGCGTLYVTVQNYGYGHQVTVSQSSITLQPGQGQQISIYGSGSYSVSSNSNPSVVSTNISGSILNVFGNAQGSSNLSVCSTQGGSCVTVYVTVSGNYYGGTTGNPNYGTPIYSNPGYNTCAYYNTCPSYVGTPVSSQTYTYDYTYSTSGNGYTDAMGRPYFDLPTGGAPVSGVYLSRVPSTGAGDEANGKAIAAGIVLAMWSAFGAFLLTARLKERGNLA
jgi:hypothetical protein